MKVVEIDNSAPSVVTRRLLYDTKDRKVPRAMDCDKLEAERGRVGDP
jgi:hypothetical protein